MSSVYVSFAKMRWIHSRFYLFTTTGQFDSPTRDLHVMRRFLSDIGMKPHANRLCDKRFIKHQLTSHMSIHHAAQEHLLFLNDAFFCFFFLTLLQLFFPNKSGAKHIRQRSISRFSSSRVDSASFCHSRNVSLLQSIKYHRIQNHSPHSDKLIRNLNALHF